MDNNMHEKY